MPASPSESTVGSGTTSNEPSESSDLSERDRHCLLASERRQTLLDVVEDRTHPIDLEDLAVAIAGREGGSVVDGEATSERVALSLHHNHLPRMTDFGVVDYDPESHRVESVRTEVLP